MLREIVKNMMRKKRAIPFPGASGDIPGEGLEITGSRLDIGGIFGRSLRIRQVDAGSCNACEWECTALTNPVYDIQRFGVDFVASPRHADMLLVTGPVSRQMELALKKTYGAVPDPKLVVACGDCARDGGVYRGSYAVVSGVSSVIPVDCYIAGCPPSPGQILSGILHLLGAAAKKTPARGA